MILQQTRGVLSSGDGLALDLPFAETKSLTARVGPTPAFTRGSSGTFVNANGIIVGKTAGTTSSITPSTISLNSEVTVTVASGSVVGWVVGQAVSLIVDTDGQDDADATELWLLGNIVSTTLTTLTFSVTSRTSKSGSATNWTLGYRGARFDHDPVTLASRGLLIEGSRTNLVFPSDLLTTQTRTVTAAAHTLSFYGTGTIVLSGAHSATVVGTGAYPSRRTLTFTPTAGSLTLTVTGTVEFAQLEAGSFASSYIPTTTATVVRSADLCSISGAAFSGMWNASEGTLFASGDKGTSTTESGSYFTFQAGATEVGPLLTRTSTSIIGRIRNNSGVDLTNTDISQSPAGERKVAVTWKATSDTADRDYASGGVILVKSNPSAGTAANNQRTMIIGARQSSAWFNGTISAIRYYRKRLSNAKLQALTA